MSREQSPAEALLIEAVAQAVTPPLKAARFRKTGMNYHRRRGETVQVVNVQVSHGSTAFHKKFYLNVGVAFDPLCRLAELPVLERPKEYECDDRGTSGRLETLIPDCPDSWVIRDDEDLRRTVQPLRRSIDRVVTELDRIDGIEAYRRHPWYDRFRPTPANARVLYMLGDLDEAWREVQALAAFFADRQNASQVEWWVKRLRLTELESRLVERPK